METTMHASKLNLYERGATSCFACQYDSRFSYYSYIPSDYHHTDSKVYNLAVVVHGTDRPAQKYRDSFIDFAEKTNTIILAPLFPAGITADRELDSYKFIKMNGIRYDLVLLAMINELKQRYRVQTNKFMLHGFSGGGHFAHRFYYIHPERLRAVSIGAPGKITLLDNHKKWYLGIEDFEEVFGSAINKNALKEVPVQMVIGNRDIETWEINNKDNDPHWMEGADTEGATRVERIRALRKNYEENGIHVQFDMVRGVAHEGFKLLPAVKDFFEEVLLKT